MSLREPFNEALNGVGPSVVRILGAKPPLPDQVERGHASEARFEATEAFIAFDEESDRINDEQNRSPAGKAAKRKELAEAGLAKIDRLRLMLGRSEGELAQVQGGIAKALGDFTPEDQRYWLSALEAKNSSERFSIARDAILDGDLVIAKALLAAPKVLKLIEDEHREELRDLLVKKVAPKLGEREAHLHTETNLGRQAIAGLQRVYEDAITIAAGGHPSKSVW